MDDIPPNDAPTDAYTCNMEKHSHLEWSKNLRKMFHTTQSSFSAYLFHAVWQQQETFKF